jgi:hypothetical protein
LSGAGFGILFRQKRDEPCVLSSASRVVGRTVPSFRIALESETSSWKDFTRSLGGGSREALNRTSGGNGPSGYVT